MPLLRIHPVHNGSRPYHLAFRSAARATSKLSPMPSHLVRTVALGALCLACRPRCDSRPGTACRGAHRGACAVRCDGEVNRAAAARDGGPPGDVAAAGRQFSRADRGIRQAGTGVERHRRRQPESARSRRRARRRTRQPRRARSASRDSSAREGQLRNDRDADDGGIDRAGVVPPGTRRVSGPAAQGRRRGDSRQDEHARAGVGDHDRRLALRPDEEPLRPRSQSRRLQRWNRRGGGGEFRRGRHGQRHLRVDPQSRVAQRSRRPAGHAGAVEPHRHRAALDHAGHRRAARAEHRGPCRHARRDSRTPIRPTPRRRSAPARFRRRTGPACAPTRSRARGSGSCAACLDPRPRIRR